MAEGDVYVRKEGDDWIVAIEGIRAAVVKYATVDEAVETATRVAAAARSNLRIDVEAKPLAASS